MPVSIRRREVIAALGGAVAAWPLAARAAECRWSAFSAPVPPPSTRPLIAMRRDGGLAPLLRRKSMRAIQVAIVKEDAGLRCFFIAEDDTTQVLRLLRTRFPDLLSSRSAKLYMYPPLNEAFGKDLNMKPSEVVEWRIVQRVNPQT
jgi:hypothetical protein